MINLRLIETNFDEFNRKLSAKKVGEGVLKNLLESYNALKTAKQECETAQSVQNAKSKELGLLARNGEDVSGLKRELEQNKALLATLNERVAKLEEELENAACVVPNLIDDDVPLARTRRRMSA